MHFVSLCNYYFTPILGWYVEKPFTEKYTLWIINDVKGKDNFGVFSRGLSLTVHIPKKSEFIICTACLKYSSDEINSSSCRCSILLGLTFVKIKKSFTKMLLIFRSYNLRIICYWKKTDESEPIFNVLMF